MKILSWLACFFMTSAGFTQRLPGYLPPVEGIRIRFDFTEIRDTIYVDSTGNGSFQTERYVFPFTKTAGEKPLLFEISRRPDGADPDYNCHYPRKPIIKTGTQDSIVICMPVRNLEPPRTHTRRYIVNSNAENTDTLTISRVYLWKE